MRTKISNSLKNGLKASTFHSVPNIIRSKYLTIKLTWITCLLFSSSYCTYLIYQNILTYSAFSVISTTRDILKNPIEFPRLTLCNLNYFSTPYARHSKDILDLIKESKQVESNSTINDEFTIKNFLIQKFTAISNSNMLNDSVKRRLGYSVKEIVVNCMFNYQTCDLDNDFVEYFDQTYGRCFKFNVDNSKMVSLSGSLNGLQLELITDSAEENDSIFAKYNGFYVFLTNDISFISFDYDGIQLPTGYSTNVLINKYSISKQPKPYSNCIDDLIKGDSYPSVTYQKSFTLNNNSYSTDMCLNMCFQIMVGAKCQCYDSTSGPYPTQDLPTCLNEADSLCDNAVWDDFVQNMNVITCDCPFPCDKTEYTFMTSLSEYPTIGYVSYLKNDTKFMARFDNKSGNIVDFNYLKKRMASVNIFYNQLKETIIEEEPKMSLTILISNIGGVMSLFLGISFLSFVEVFELCFNVFFIFLEELKTKNNLGNNN